MEQLKKEIKRLKIERMQLEFHVERTGTCMCLTEYLLSHRYKYTQIYLTVVHLPNHMIRQLISGCKHALTSLFILIATRLAAIFSY